jgi:Helix-turn-helix domain
MSLEINPFTSISIQIFPDGRLDTKNAALYLGLKEKTLAMMRGTGAGPRFIKRGRIFYFKEDLDAWLNAEGRLVSTAQSLKRSGVL